MFFWKKKEEKETPTIDNIEDIKETLEGASIIICSDCNNKLKGKGGNHFLDDWDGEYEIYENTICTLCENGTYKIYVKKEIPDTHPDVQKMKNSGEKLIEKVKVEIEKLRDNIKSHNHSQKPDKDYNLLDINDIIDNKIILEENHD